MPARLHLATASRTSPRGGSCRPTSPSSVSPCSISASTIESGGRSGNDSSTRSAMANTRSASLASNLLAWIMATRSSAVMGLTPSLVCMKVQSSRMTSGAPLTKARGSCGTSLYRTPWALGVQIGFSADLSSSQRRMTVIRLRSESNGRAANLGISISTAARLMPHLAAATSNAPSVGSPTISERPSRTVNSASLQATAAHKSADSAGSSRCSLPSHMNEPMG